MERMLVRMAAVTIAALLLETQLAAEERAPERSVRSIAGQVVDARRAPVVDAFVLLCEQSSGIPLMEKTFRRISDVLLDGETNFSEVACRRTDEQGRFRFEGVPASQYRLVAQSWPDAQPKGEVLEHMQKNVQLCGIADDLTVADNSSPEVVPLVLQANKIVFPSLGGMQGAWHRSKVISEHLDREVTLPSGTKATFGDLMTVIHYLRTEQLRERGEK